MNSVRPWFVFVAVVASLVAGQLRYAVVFDDLSLPGSVDPTPNDDQGHSPDRAATIDERRERPLPTWAGGIGANVSRRPELSLTENDRNPVGGTEVATAGPATHAWPVGEQARSFSTQDLRFNSAPTRLLDLQWAVIRPGSVAASDKDR